MTEPVIHRISTLDLNYAPFDWPFARERQGDIAAHFASRRQRTPALWNGRILLGRDPVFAGNRLSASYFDADFAGMLAWRDWGFPDESVFNGFGMGALRCADGAFVMGVMSEHTSNAGRIYFPAGTPDLDDIADGRIDIEGSIVRELEEETGLSPGDYRMEADWHCVSAGAAIAMFRILEAPIDSEDMRVRIEANLARQAQPELAGIHLVRDISDLTADMPRFLTAFMEQELGRRKLKGARS
ncbi:MAG: NUDIX hydrolase [Bradyrhizobium sp.]|uniref:NUDIX hydrolase n=1 Tax=Bradyrhizobium sp. TaxID=376 RepID=UPI001D96EA7B|nr:NUDIX hydrolase [Bradyrhizobium sp.]MBV9563095.1 NUDIX hydrolase [Bradyrhizobium sp.]